MVLQVSGLQEKKGGAGEYDNMILSWSEIIEMSKNGISFGSHTISHPMLSKIDNIKLKEEIGKSKLEIEKKFGRSVTAFSYPIGTATEITDSITEVVKRSGYNCACSAIIGSNDIKSDLFSLRRIGIERSDTMYVFKKKVAGALDIMFIKDSVLGYKVKNFIASIFGMKSFTKRYYNKNLKK